jgi:hypothetical protein
MTRLALVTEVSRHVVRDQCSLEIRRVALVTIGIDQLVVAIYMTRLALNCRMCSRQNELRRVMIECCRLPCSGRMA